MSPERVLLCFTRFEKNDLRCVSMCRWLDKLGLGAALGLDVVMRQVLVGSGSYHMVDDDLDPLPVRLEHYSCAFYMWKSF